jgi:hypothetical protein
MVDEAQEKPLTYRVILKSGTYGDFTNDNHFDHYKDRLISGIYSITDPGGEFERVTLQSVLRIDELKEDDQTDSN